MSVSYLLDEGTSQGNECELPPGEGQVKAMSASFLLEGGREQVKPNVCT